MWQAFHCGCRHGGFCRRDVSQRLSAMPGVSDSRDTRGVLLFRANRAGARLARARRELMGGKSADAIPGRPTGAPVTRKSTSQLLPASRVRCTGAGRRSEILPAVTQRGEGSRVEAATARLTQPWQTGRPNQQHGAVEGSGTGPDLPVVPQPMETWFVSSVTALISARAVPHTILAPVCKRDAVARENISFERSAGAESRSTVDLPIDVALTAIEKNNGRVAYGGQRLPIWKTKTASGSPWSSRVSVPISTGNDDVAQ